MTLKGKRKTLRNIIAILTAIILIGGVTSIAYSISNQNPKIVFKEKEWETTTKFEDNEDDWVMQKNDNSIEFIVDLSDYLDKLEMPDEAPGTGDAEGDESTGDTEGDNSGNNEEDILENKGSTNEDNDKEPTYIDLSKLVDIEFKYSSLESNQFTKEQLKDNDKKYTEEQLKENGKFTGKYLVKLPISTLTENQEEVSKDFDIKISINVKEENKLELTEEVIKNLSNGFVVKRDLTEPTIEAAFTPGNTLKSWNDVAINLSEVADVTATISEDENILRNNSQLELPKTVKLTGISAYNFKDLQEYGDGNYKIELYAVDKAGNISETNTYNVVINSNGPAIKIQQSAYLNETTEYFKSSYKSGKFTVIIEDNNKINIDTLNIEVIRKDKDANSDIPVSIDKSNNNKTVLAEFELNQEGNYYINIFVSDTNGQETTRLDNIIIDNSNPDIKASIFKAQTDSKGEYVEITSEKTVYINQKDNELKDNKKHLLLEIDDNCKINEVKINNEVKDVKSDDDMKTATFAMDFTEGNHRVDVIATDAAGNKVSKTINIVVDTTPVELKPTFNDNDSKKEYYNEDVKFNMEFNDNNFDLSQTTIEVNNGLVDENEFANGKFTKIFSADGIYKIEVSTIDIAGNKSSAEYTFTVDKEKPKVKVSIFKAKSDSVGEYVEVISEDPVYINKKDYELKSAEKYKNKNHLLLKFEDNYKINEVKINGEKVEVTSTDDMKKVTLGRDFTPGKYTLEITGTDVAGNELKKTTIELNVDIEEPIVGINHTANGDENNGFYLGKNSDSENGDKNITITFNDVEKLSDKNTIVVTEIIEKIDGQATEKEVSDIQWKSTKNEDGSITYTSGFNTNDGKYKVVAEAKDAAGNTKKSELIINVDRTSPEIVIDNYLNLNEQFIQKLENDINISIKEANLADDITIVLDKIAPIPKEEGNDNKSEEDLKELINKINNSDKYEIDLEASKYFTENSDYKLALTIKDKAGNEAILKDSQGKTILNGVDSIDLSFTIDNKLPEFRIETVTQEGENKQLKTLQSNAFLGMNDSKIVRFTITDANLINAIADKDKENTIKVEEKNLATNQKEDVVLDFKSVIEVKNDERVIALILEHDFSVGKDEEKEYTVNISSTDKAGNNDVKEFKFTVDNKAPEIKADKLENEVFKYFNEKDDKEIKINISDINLADKDEKGKDLNTATITTKNQDNNKDTEFKPYTVDGAEIGGIKVDGSTGEFTHNFNDATANEMDSRVYKVIVKAVDKANNISTATYDFEVDNGTPKVIFDGVTEGKYFGLGADNKPVNNEITAYINDINVYDDKNINIKNTIEVIHNEKNITDSVGKFIKSANGQIKSEMSFIEEGVYKITVDSTDKAGNKVTDKNVNFTIDNTPATIAVSGLEENKQYYSINQIPLNIKLTDNYGLKESENNKITIITESLNDEKNNEPLEFNLLENKSEFVVIDEKNIEFNYTFTKEATYTVIIETEDLAGNKSNKTVVFTIDRTTPEVTINNYDVLNGSYNQTASDLIFTIEEENFRNDKIENGNGAKRIPYTLEVKYDKETPEDNNDITDTNLEFTQVGDKNFKTEYKIDSSKFIDAAKYTVKVIVKDAAGNNGVLKISKDKKEDNVKVEFTTDTVAPEMKVYLDGNEKTDDELNKSGVHEYQSKTVKITTYDVNQKENIIKVTRNGEDYKVNGFTTESRTRTFEHNFTEEGNYKVTATSTDLSGRVTTRTFSFIIDTTKPVITIENFDELNNSFNNPGKSLKVIVDELNYTYNKVNVEVKKILEDTTVVPVSLNFANNGTKSVNEYSVFGDDARYEITLSATDLAGNKADEKHLYFVMTTDITKPVATITGIENGEHYNKDKEVTVSVVDVNHDINRVTITKDGKEYFTSEQFSISGDTNVKTAALSKVISEEGEYVVTVYSKDKAGNELGSVVTKTFTIDKTAPKITPLFKGENREIKNGEFINKIFTPEFKLDESEDWFISLTLNGKDVNNAVPMASTEMKYEFIGLATDKAGNTTPLNISFTIDVTNPEVKVTGIINGFFSESMKPEYSITDTNLDKSKTHALMNGKEFASGTLIEAQDYYNFKLLGTDLASNETARNIVFAIDKDKPVIKFLEAMSGQYFTEDFIPNFIIEDLTDYTIVSMTLDGEDYELGDKITEEGKHVLYIEVKDKAENIESISVEFILDKTPPKFIVNGIKDKGVYFDAVTAEITLENPLDKITGITVNGELAEGDIKEENGQQVAKLNFNEVKEYEVVLNAIDEAGNKTEEVIKFEITHKNIFTAIYKNKTLFYPTILTLAGIISLISVKVLKNNKVSNIDSEEESGE